MERICREADKRCYQPRIHSEKIQRLYGIGKETGLPITVLVDYSLGKFIEAYDKKKAEKEALKDELAWRQEEEWKRTQEEMNNDAEDLSVYLDAYQNDPYGEDY